MSDARDTTVELKLTSDMLPDRPEASARAYLVVIAGPRLGVRTLLAENAVDIGRSSKCALQLDYDSVSRQHAQVIWTGHHELVDLGSTNGTYVNDVKIARSQLHDGDRVGIGKALLKYISGDNVEAAYHEEIQRLVSHDGLTGIPNKTHFHQHLGETLGRDSGTAHSLILFDLDHFKAVNDTHGHTAGDFVLRQAAEVAQRLVEAPRLLARTGGEEFAVLCPGESHAVAWQVAESLRANIEHERFRVDGVEIPVTASFGVAESAPTAPLSPEQLYEAADTRLYAAKDAGRNCVR